MASDPKIVIRKRNGREYAELHRSVYDPKKGRSHSEYVAYLGAVRGYDENGDPVIAKSGAKAERIVFLDVLKEVIEERSLNEGNLPALMDLLFAGRKPKKALKPETQPPDFAMPGIDSHMSYSLKSPKYSGFYEMMIAQTHGIPAPSIRVARARSAVADKARWRIFIEPDAGRTLKDLSKEIGIAEKASGPLQSMELCGHHVFGSQANVTSWKRELALALAFRRICLHIERKLEAVGTDPFQCGGSLANLMTASLIAISTKFDGILLDWRLETIVEVMIVGGEMLTIGTDTFYAVTT